MRSGASSYCTRQGYRVAAGGEPFATPCSCRRTTHAMVAHAQSVSPGRATLSRRSQLAGEQRTAWPRKEHVGQPQVPIQLTPRPHRELQRMSDDPQTQIQPAMAAPHMPMQARLAAWPRRDLERSGMPICRQTTYAMPARRVALGQTTTS